jgi:cytochrome c biogenesis protein CcmG/thiol:disulfide interchange protein DsbE
MNKLQLSMPIAAFCLLTTLLWRGLYLDPKELPSVLIDREVPQFNLHSVVDKQLLSNPDLPSQIYLLNVWGSYCLPCLAEHPTLMRLAEEQEIPIIGINYKDRPRQAENWLQEHGNPFNFSISDQDGRFGIDLGVYGAPETFLVDAKGIIRFRHVSVLDEQVWEEVMLPAIAIIQGET